MIKKHSLALLIILTLVFFVWPIAATIALRYTLLFMLLVVVLVQWDRAAGGLFYRDWRAPVLGIGLFTVWIFIELAFTPFWRQALHAIGGQWVNALGAALVGVGFGLRKTGPSAYAVLVAFVAVLFINILVVDGQGLLWAIHHGRLPMGLAGRRMPGLTEGPDKSNYLTNMLLDILVAEVSLRLEDRRYLPLGKNLLALFLVLTALSSYLEGMRNGLIDIVLLTAFIIARFVYLHRQHFGPGRRLLVSLVTLAALALIGVDLRFDPRWDSLFATLPVAWNTAAHRAAWLDPGTPLPLLPNGQVVAQSNYLRIAWIKEGAKSLWDYPLGLGYSRSAFGKALLLRFGPGAATATSTNDGLFNLGIGVGFPGLILWYGWYGWLMRNASRYFTGPAAFWGRSLFLVLLDAGTRMLVDANMQDYMLEQFLFLIAFLASGATVARQAADGDLDSSRVEHS